MKIMNEKKFLQQVYGKLKNQLEQEVKFAVDSIEISEGDKVIFRIDSKGDMLYSADKQFSNIVNNIHGKIENVVFNTKEYLKVMDNSPELTAVDLNVPYKKLLEYNNVVLAGTEHSNESFEFVTWEYKNKRTLLRRLRKSKRGFCKACRVIAGRSSILC